MPEHTPAPTPSRAVYGFVMFLSFKIFFILYIIWAFLPTELFEMMGIEFLPQRYWAVAMPIYVLIILTVFAFILYPSLGMFMTPSVDDMRTIRDECVTTNNKVTKSRIKDLKCVCRNSDKCYVGYYAAEEHFSVKRPIPSLTDLNMWDVSEHLYLK